MLPQTYLQQAYAGVIWSNPVNRHWVAWFCLVAAYLLVWWIHLYPGVATFDSGYYMQQVVQGEYTNKKPFLYARFLQATSLGGRDFAFSAFLQVMLVALALSRILALATSTRPRWLAIALGLVLIANPYMGNMAAYIQNDILFSVAMILVIAESIHVARLGRISRASIVVVALFAPMAFLFRENGRLFIPLWMLACVMVMPRPSWTRLVGAAAITSALAFATVIGVDRQQRQHPLYGAVIHEAVGLAQPRYRVGMGFLLSPETQSAIGRERLASAVSVYWPLYWDTIAFVPTGPKLDSISDWQRNAITDSFLRNDVYPNLPAIVGHRFEMFLGALLARAEPINPYESPGNAPQAYASAKERHRASPASVLRRVNEASIRSRGWSWNALLGMTVLAGMTLSGLWRRDRVMVLMATVLWTQAAAIWLAAPSAEFRYVFMFYLAPLLWALPLAQPVEPSPAAAP